MSDTNSSCFNRPKQAAFAAWLLECVGEDRAESAGLPTHLTAALKVGEGAENATMA
jgi:hypothetical protein